MSASDAVWSLFSGLPSSKRGNCLIMVLQAAIDDSGEMDEWKDPMFVLAGFIADSTDWAEFSDEWEKALLEFPTIEYFKMVEASGLRGQFAG